MEVSHIEGLWASNPRSWARAYHVPIEHREKVLAAYREARIKVRIRYQGPRSHSIGRTMKGVNGAQDWIRGSYQAQLTCLREDAKSFSVYDR